MDTELQQLAKTNRNPVQETRYQELLRQQPQGGSSAPVSGGSTNDPSAIIRESIKRMQEANAPAVQSLQASIPEVQSKYAQTRQQLQAQQPSLEQRYQQTLDSIKNQKTQDVNAQTRITSNEMGKRGLTGDSTLAQQEIQNAVQPVNAQYTNLEQQTALSREDAIRALQNQLANLTPQETADTRSIQNAIAQLQSGAASQGVTQGMNLYQNQLQQQMQQAEQARLAEQSRLAQQFEQQKFQAQQQQQALENRLQQEALARQLAQTQAANASQTNLISFLQNLGKTNQQNYTPATGGFSGFWK